MRPELDARFDGVLVRISIGKSVLKFAFENAPNNTVEEVRQVAVVDEDALARDICTEMNREGEDGSTPLTRFMDSMMEEALNSGSMAFQSLTDPDPDDEPDSEVSR